MGGCVGKNAQPKQAGPAADAQKKPPTEPAAAGKGKGSEVEPPKEPISVGNIRNHISFTSSYRSFF